MEEIEFVPAAREESLAGEERERGSAFSRDFLVYPYFL